RIFSGAVASTSRNPTGSGAGVSLLTASSPSVLPVLGLSSFRGGTALSVSSPDVPHARAT
ncbi:MAG TPA: hypothetical protein VIT23_13145, partial [Terrimicrobiaceae bacterium]